jgi:hypothetical protein
VSTSPLVHGTLGDEQLIDELAAYRRRVAGSYKPLLPADISSLAAGRMRVSEKIKVVIVWKLHSMEIVLLNLSPLLFMVLPTLI